MRSHIFHGMGRGREQITRIIFRIFGANYKGNCPSPTPSFHGLCYLRLKMSAKFMFFDVRVAASTEGNSGKLLIKSAVTR